MPLTHVVHRQSCCALSVWLGLGLAVLIAAPRPAVAAQSQASGAARQVSATALPSMAAASLPWVANAGQWDARAAFRAQSFAGAVWVTQDGALVHEFNGIKRTESTKPTAARGDGSPARGEPFDPRHPGWVLTERFVGGAVKQAPRGNDPQLGKVSFMTHGTAVQAADVQSYGQVELGEVFPGVSVALKATNANVEKLFTVAPGRDPGVIRMAVDGAERLSIGDDGRLIATTGNGDIAFTAPVAFQEIDGVRRDVQVAYSLDAARHRYGFFVSAYDRNRPLVIDPLLASTYLGGTAFEQVNAIAIHPHTGDVYVAGFTDSALFPQSALGAQSTATGRSCFVSRYSADLSRLIQSSYVGSGGVLCTSVAVSAADGSVYVAGRATGTSTFSNTAGAIQPTHANAGNGTVSDGFVARLSADLRTLHRATFFGGAGDVDQVYAVAVHPHTGLVYIVGRTDSTALPGSAAGTQTTFAGATDAFVARFPADLSGAANVRYTFIGGASTDVGYALAVDPASGDVFVAGTSYGGLPSSMVVGAAQTAHAGGGDAFVARLKPDLSVVRATYLGGNDEDRATSLALDSITGDVVIAGFTRSTSPNALPQSAGGAQSAYGGGSADGFAARLAGDLTAIRQTSYLGASGWECETFSCVVAIHPQSGEVIVAGATDAGLPSAFLADGYQTSAGGAGEDAFVVRFNAQLTQSRGGTLLGGASVDGALGLAIEPNGASVYIAGRTLSAFPIVNAQQSTPGGSGEGFVSRFSTDLTALNRTPNPFSFIAQSNVPPNTTRTSNEVQLIISPTPPDNHQTAYVTGGTNSEFCVTNTAGCCATPLPACSGFASGWITAPYQFLSGDRIAVRHTSANPSGTTETKLIISGTAYPFRSSTGNANIGCNLDMNGDNQLTSNVEGLILVRAMLGFGADAIVANTGVFPWDPVRRRLNEFCGTNFPFSPSAFQ